MAKAGFGVGKVIQTSQLLIRDNIMCWGNTRLQISNISSISDGEDQYKFPGISIVLILAGLYFAWMAKEYYYLEELFGLLSPVCFLTGVVMIVFWALAVKNKSSYLVIRMNSGESYRIAVKDRVFLLEIIEVLEAIIMNGGTTENITIQNNHVLFDYTSNEYISDERQVNFNLNGSKITAEKVSIGNHIK